MVKGGGGEAKKIKKGFEGYKVQEGDTVSEIAKRFNVTEQDIINANPILQGENSEGKKNADYLFTDQILSIPTHEIVYINNNSSNQRVGTLTETTKTNQGATIHSHTRSHGQIPTHHTSGPQILEYYKQVVPKSDYEYPEPLLSLDEFKYPYMGFVKYDKDGNIVYGNSDSNMVRIDKDSLTTVSLGSDYYWMGDQSPVRIISYNPMSDAFHIQHWNQETRKYEYGDLDRSIFLKNTTDIHPSKWSVKGERIVAYNPEKGYYRTVNKDGDIVNHNLVDLRPEYLDKPEYSDEYESLVKAYREKHKKNTE